MAKSSAAIKPEDYTHSPVHYAVARGDHAALSRIISDLPRLADPETINTESDSIVQQRLAQQISAVIDRRDVPFKETPLHLAVRLNDAVSARALAGAGANYFLQNSSGWNPLQEALCRRSSDVARVLLRLREPSAWAKWRRRLPSVIAVLGRMRDFYMEISFHFESSMIPFFSRMAPSDTYKIWKRNGNLRADTSLAGFDGMKIKRADKSLLFLGEGDSSHNVRPGSLLVLKRDDRKISETFKNAGEPLSEPEIVAFLGRTTVHRPGMDFSKSELVGRTNWRKQQLTETVGDWKAKVYEINNVVIRCRIRKVVVNDSVARSVEVDEELDGSLAAANHGSKTPDRKSQSSPLRQDQESNSAGRKAPAQGQTSEKECVKSLRPSVWLTDQFPLKMEEMLPLLDILVNRVKAMRKMRELLTAKFPPGTFPVKVAIPVVPTVRVVITFTKFIELQPIDQFYTPPSSPRELDRGHEEEEEDHKSKSWWSSSSSTSKQQQQKKASSEANQPDPFAIPDGYTWSRKTTKKSK